MLIGMACAVAVLGSVAAPVAAAEEGTVESRLRQALRSATAQQRTLEDENATLRAKQGQDERQLKEATAALAAQQPLVEQLRLYGIASAEDAKKLHDAAAELPSKLRASEQAQSEAEATLAKWQDAYKNAAEVARARDADAKLLTAQLGQSLQRGEACELMNGKLFKLGNEILALYESKGPLSSLLEREPVTQIKRVELENIVQDYQDKLLDEKVPAEPRR